MTYPKSKICRLCNASFVADFKHQIYCLDCYNMVSLKTNDDLTIDFKDSNTEIKINQVTAEIKPKSKNE